MDENAIMMMWSTNGDGECEQKKKEEELKSLSSIINISFETRGPPKQHWKRKQRKVRENKDEESNRDVEKSSRSRNVARDEEMEIEDTQKGHWG